MLRHLANGDQSLTGRIDASCRADWEFYAVLEGRCAPVFRDDDWPELQEKTLWLFAPDCRHGWIGERGRPHFCVALHYDSVPHQLGAFVHSSPGNYHAMQLDDRQVARLKAIAAELEPHH